MRLSFLAPIALALHNAAYAAASTEPEQLSSRSSAFVLTDSFIQDVEKIMDKVGIPGMTLGVVFKNGPPEVGALGIKSEDGTKMTTDTLFNIGHCSAAFVSVSLGMLIEDYANGRNSTPLPGNLTTLSWKTKVIDILPDSWGLLDPWATQKASLIDILTHMTGVANHDLSYKPNDTLETMTANLRNIRPSWELREQWWYNNQMYMVGSYIVSTLSGMRYPDFVGSRIFTPLGMSSSTFSIDAAVQTGRFTETWTSFGRLIPPWLHEEFVDLMAGAVGVISSVEDLSPWIQMFLNSGVDPNTNTTILELQNFDAITWPQSVMDRLSNSLFSPELFGLGWSRLSFIIMHNGSAPGVSVIMAASLSDGFAVVALANADEKELAVLDIVFKVAEKAWGVSPPYATIDNADDTPDQPYYSPTKRALVKKIAARSDSSGTPTPPPNPDDFVGTYYNNGYGTSVVCSANSQDPACQSVLKDFRSYDDTVNSDSTDLFLSWITPWTTNIRFTFLNDTQYLVYGGSIYPEGYGKNTTAFAQLDIVAIAEFEVDNGTVKGYGLIGTNDVEGGSVEQTAGVWFARQG
ncbi:beta-lactamase/transpeptidase-like protein [Russula earlei]|uniref:Beta-lactamase/transpeptidase-like protein n=1 Tax=Russula earlei TaxID=71964 RepID=A0ACC0UDQ7_9AGAM|nr:beta-lactamase/transpeptidase-like protein [Russula earlei]